MANENKVSWVIDGNVISVEEFHRKVNIPHVPQNKERDEFILQLKSNEFSFYNQRTKVKQQDSSQVKIYKYFLNNEWMYFKGNTVPCKQNKIDRDTYFEILYQ